MPTVLTDDAETTLSAARADGDSLWLSPRDLETATGWSLKPEGLCKAEVCVPVPKSGSHVLVRGSEIDVAAFWRHMGHPVAHDATGEVWVLGTGAQARAAALQSQQAPDFRLPDLAGSTHALSDYRGAKVLLATWASW